MEKINQYQIPQAVSNNQQSQPPGPKLFSLTHKYLAILVTLLCLTSLGSAFLLLSTHNKKDYNPVSLIKENIIRSPSPTPTPKQMLEDIQETLGWNIYSNSQYDYSIKYPIDWNATIIRQEDPKILEYVVFNPLTATKAGELSVTLTYTTRSYKEVLDSDPQPGEIITVSSTSATRKLKQDSQRNVLISIALPHNSNTFVFLGKEKYKDIFTQMLSTLKLKVQ